MSGVMTVLGLLTCVAALVPLANRLSVPYPILLVLGGLIMGFIPVLPDVVLQPDLVFVLFLPPLLYWSSLTTPWRDFRANLRPILLLAIGLVVVTMCGVAVIAHLTIPGLTWPLAFVLGAIVSPPDAVAATAITDRLAVPQQVVTILEGESLVNDATALVAYSTAVAVVIEGRFSVSQVSIQFAWAAIGGIVIGWGVGWIVSHLREKMTDPILESTVSLLTPFAAYLPAYGLAASGVLAAVVAGFVMQRRSPVVITSRTRLQTDSVWEVVNFLLNGLIFILIGLQLHPIFVSLSGRPLSQLVWDGIIISLTAIVVRISWVFLATFVPRMFRWRLTEGEDTPRFSHAAVIGWTGMRGVVSLAAAQALPEHSGAGAFPQRDLIIYLSFCVILSTLVVQGLSLPAVIRRLKLSEDGIVVQEDMQARLAATQAALNHLQVLEQGDGVIPELVDDLRRHYRARAGSLQARIAGRAHTTYEQRHQTYQQLRRELLNVEHQTIMELRDSNVISDEAFRQVQRDLDLDIVRAEADRPAP